ncbi:nucleotidyl transferase AbiEii/AbiGii toxin family protein [Flavobacterium sp. Sd200]|uniref:nucleotidyl transferase AbiEii/AbiGii toxin family protein n=1 Tax=Flavobacterium sp. Sd200 TaxID=2692211 RepID=UPI001F27A48D|nr:nucleotidyl transferase AbiEii/AbiGii toxin family protein [Flavobacterium sp. Sd200]
MELPELHPFRLVGGTSLSLQHGHRISMDIDLFTDADYGSIDFDKIEQIMTGLFGQFEKVSSGPVGMGRSYFLGTDPENTIKLDLFYTTDPFMQDTISIDGIRMATTEEIIAMKVDIIQRGGRKKDFFDLFELLPAYPIARMLALHALRYPYSHDRNLIIANFTRFEEADTDFDPECMRGRYWEFIKEDFEIALKEYRSQNL